MAIRIKPQEVIEQARKIAAERFSDEKGTQDTPAARSRLRDLVAWLRRELSGESVVEEDGQFEVKHSTDIRPLLKAARLGLASRVGTRIIGAGRRLPGRLGQRAQATYHQLGMTPDRAVIDQAFSRGADASMGLAQRGARHASIADAHQLAQRLGQGVGIGAGIAGAGGAAGLATGLGDPSHPEFG